MNVASRVRVPGQKTPVVGFLHELTALINDGKYREASEAFLAFEKDNATSDFMVEEAMPFRVQNHMIAKLGRTTPFVKMTLKKPTWAVELTHAFHDPAKFEAYVKALEAEVKTYA